MKNDNKPETLSSIKQKCYSLCQSKFNINKEDVKEFTKWMVKLCASDDPNCSTTDLAYKEPWLIGYNTLLNTDQGYRVKFVKNIIKVTY
ncbi:hypothetical protein ELBI_70 [Anabaena phage Elbi]|nr:hypothetical protein ELBI_70 [Anabaena phage Elbi]